MDLRIVARAIQHSTLNIQQSPFASSPDPFTYRIAKMLPILPHLVAPDIRRFHDSGQRLASVRRDLVPVLHTLSPHDELRIAIEGDDVRVVTGSELPFAMPKSRQ